MSLFVVDCESDGPIPNVYSMVCFGAVKLDEDLKTTFYGQTKPISEKYNPDALKVSGFSREEHLNFEDPKEVMVRFSEWIAKNSVGRPIFISDNPAYDWQWINYYFHFYLGNNPFGFSARRIGDLYSGLVRDMYKSSDWKSLKTTKHTHNPVDDAMGNAEALIVMSKKYNMRLPK